ncbi:TcpD family membrane protein [Staphylococcus caeli]|uniref:Transposon-related protein n=1 Tax=Staphylococcus caeli TaxID=2201815 RepID=A0A1D4Q0A7_9STAP|nr:TcpD family membrane protein [Staphylococcus caeli]SCT28627.1 transposon-related protein [Staphylococcus caeli]SCT33506.1 transposon-related protein [Staphylococcus caeli]
MLNMLNSLFVLGAGRPSISGLDSWISSEVGTGIGIIVLIVGVVQWATGKYGRMAVLFLVGGLMFLVSKGPERVFNALSGIWEMIFGG